MFESLSWWYGYLGDILWRWWDVWLVTGGLLLALVARLLIADFLDSGVGKLSESEISKRFSRWLTGGLVVGGFIFLLTVGGMVVSTIHDFQDHNYSLGDRLVYDLVSAAPVYLGFFLSEFVPFWLYRRLWRMILKTKCGRYRSVFLEFMIAGGLIGMALILAFAPGFGALNAFLLLVSRHEETWILFFMIGMPVPLAACVATIGMVFGLSFAAIFVLVATGWQRLRANGRSVDTTA